MKEKENLTGLAPTRQARKPYCKPEMNIQLLQSTDVLTDSGFHVYSEGKKEAQIVYSFWSE